uniref:Uncharacterized protein n=1 Tax=Anopheles funestus TaxID=62324 RepID=A0A182RLE1_ANOFN
MGDFVNSNDIHKKYYRLFLKGLAYYTCHLNKACTLGDLQAYVFMKNLQKLSEADLTFLSQEVMRQLVATGIAYNQNGYYRLNELLRFANGSSSKQPETIHHSPDTELSSGSGLRKKVNFHNNVTMWPTDTLDGALSNPTPYLSESGSTNKTDADNQSDSDEDDDDNDGERAETNPSASQGKTEPEAKKDSESNSSLVTLDDTDDEDSNTSHKAEKQEPDKEQNNTESEDDNPKKE